MVGTRRNSREDPARPSRRQRIEDQEDEHTRQVDERSSQEPPRRRVRHGRPEPSRRKQVPDAEDESTGEVERPGEADDGGQQSGGNERQGVGGGLPRRE